MLRVVTPAHKRLSLSGILISKNYIYHSGHTHWVCYKAGLTLEQWAFYRYQHHLGRTNIAELLFVNFYIYIFIQQRFRAGRAMNSSPAASPAR